MLMIMAMVMMMMMVVMMIKHDDINSDEYNGDNMSII
jgi:hypothetical protein